MSATNHELSRRLERPLISTALRELLQRGDHKGAQRLLDETERKLREAPREAGPTEDA